MIQNTVFVLILVVDILQYVDQFALRGDPQHSTIEVHALMVWLNICSSLLLIFCISTIVDYSALVLRADSLPTGATALLTSSA